MPFAAGCFFCLRFIPFLGCVGLCRPQICGYYGHFFRLLHPLTAFLWRILVAYISFGFLDLSHGLLLWSFWRCCCCCCCVFSVSLVWLLLLSSVHHKMEATRHLQFVHISMTVGKGTERVRDPIQSLLADLGSEGTECTRLPPLQRLLSWFS